MIWQVIDGDNVIFEHERQFMAWLYAMNEEEIAREKGRSRGLIVKERKGPVAGSVPALD